MSDRQQDRKKKPVGAADLRKRAEEQVGAMESASLSAQTPEAAQQLIHELRVNQIELELQNEELRTAQDQIEAGRVRYFDLYDLAPVGYVTVSKKGLILEANLTAATLLGVNRGALVKQPLTRFIFKEDQDIYYLHRKILFESGEPQSWEIRLVRPDGSTFWAYLTATFAQAEDGEPVYHVVLSDISKRKQAEERVTTHLQLLQIAGKTAKFGGWSVDLTTQTCQWSDMVTDIHEMPHGYTPNVKESIKFYAPEWQERITEIFSNCAHKGIPYDEEMEIITGKGKRKWVRTTGRAVKNKKGEIVKVVGSFQDITRHKKVEQELREEKTLLTAVMDNLPIGIAVNTVFPSVDFVYLNDKFAQIYRTTRKKLSRPGAFWDVTYKDPVFRSQLKKRVEDNIASGDPKRMHWENIPVTRKGKKTSYISAYNIPIPGKDLIISTVMDVTDINQSQQKLRKTMNASIETISKISEIRDFYTAGHQYRVYQLSVAIARKLHLSREKTEAVRIAALIHDIGKMAIPSEILTKPGKLGEIEFDLIKEHPQTGYEILKDIDFPYSIAKIVRQHHERINGSGYPQGLKEKDILLEAKIIGVADVVEATSSHRPYRAALGIEVALDEITKSKGVLYDPEIVDVCVKLFQEKGFKFE